VAQALATLEEITESVGGTAAPVPVPTHDDKLGRYVLRFNLASGGMATVYLAIARGASGFGRAVAVKRIHPHLASEAEFVEMFLDEARIAARIRHPNVCSVEDFGEADGSYYMTMEYLSGETLSRVARQMGPMPPSIAARIVADAAEGLHAAHELEGDDGQPMNVVHRDVSPQNLFVGYDGVVKVVDFGIAKAEHRIHETATGMVKGKFAYMAPEQLRGAALDRRADVWSLGIVLWELIAGQKLFRRDNQIETLMAVQKRHVPLLSTFRDDISWEIDDVIQRALAPRPEDRFATARDMGRELNRILSAGGGAVDVPELSDMMGRLFARRRDAQRELMRSALTSPTPPSHRLYPRLPGREEEADADPSRSGIVMRRRRGSPSLLRRAALTFALTFFATISIGGGYLLLRGADPNPETAPVTSVADR